MKPERETSSKRLLMSRNKLRVAGVKGVGQMGWLCDGHWGGYVLW